jgi:hypothetical protein
MVALRMIRAAYHALFALSLVAGAVTGCGGSKNDARRAVPVVGDGDASTPTRAPSETGYDVVIAAASCWLGGLWGDAEGEEGAAARRAGTAKRCMQVAHAILGQDDPMKAEALRVLDPSSIDELVAKVKELSHDDVSLDAFATAIIAEAREAAAARRAASRIRADIEKLKSDKEKRVARERDADKLTADEASVAPALRAGSALDALVKLADHAADAHAIALMFALTRVRAAQDLPMHMRLQACAPVFSAVFGVAPPVPKRGAWLATITQTAKACGHPVPDSAKTPRDKEAAAWAGMLTGFAERLEGDEAQVKNEVLLDAMRGIVTRLKRQ